MAKIWEERRAALFFSVFSFGRKSFGCRFHFVWPTGQALAATSARFSACWLLLGLPDVLLLLLVVVAAAWLHLRLA